METRNERRSVVASGKTVQDAIDHGLTMLGVRRDQVDVEVLTEGSRGVLGFGAENARVRLSVKLPSPPQPPTPMPELAPVSVATPAPAREEEPARASAAPEEVGRECLLEILRLMDIEATVETSPGHELAEEGQPPPLVLNLTGGDLGILIGRRGETLGALQYLVRLMVSHRLKQWNDLVVDVENYRVRRRRTLQNLARRVADRVISTGQAQALEPMPPYERRLVHVALRRHPKVTTQSVGEGEKRRVTIVPKRK